MRVQAASVSQLLAATLTIMLVALSSTPHIPVPHTQWVVVEMTALLVAMAATTSSTLHTPHSVVIVVAM